MLKLQQRKQRVQGDAGSSGTASALKFLEALNSAQKTQENMDANRKPASNKGDMEDQAGIIDKLHTENKHLLSLLQDFKDMKSLLLARSQELEGLMLVRESSRKGGGADELDTFLVTQNLLLIENQALSEADRIRFTDEIASLVSQFRANQSDLSRFLIAQLQTCYLHVHSDSVSQAFDALHRLRALLAAQPSGVQAAQKLGENLSKAIVAAASEEAAKELRSMQNKNNAASMSYNNPSNLNTTSVATNKSAPFSAKPSAAEGSAEKNTSSSEEVEHLLQQNETLRNTIAQLRQRLAQNKASGGAHEPGNTNAGISGNNSSGRRSSIMGRKKDQSQGTSTNNNNNNTNTNNSNNNNSNNNNSNSDHNNNNKGHINAHNLSDPSAFASSGPVDFSSATSSFNMPVVKKKEFPSSSSSSLQQHIASHITSEKVVDKMMREHSLFPNTEKCDPIIEEMLSIMAEEIETNLVFQDLLAELFSEALHSRRDWRQSVELYYRGEEDALFWSREEVKIVLDEAARDVAQLSAVHDLVWSLSSLYLSYLHSLFELECLHSPADSPYVAQDMGEDDAPPSIVTSNANQQQGNAASPRGLFRARSPPSPTHSFSLSQSQSQSYAASASIAPTPSLSSPAPLYHSNSHTLSSNNAYHNMLPSNNSEGPIEYIYSSNGSNRNHSAAMNISSPNCNSSAKLPRYMMPSKSSSFKNRGKSARVKNDTSQE